MLETQNIQFSYNGNHALKFPNIHCKKGRTVASIGAIKAVEKRPYCTYLAVCSPLSQEV